LTRFDSNANPKHCITQKKEVKVVGLKGLYPFILKVWRQKYISLKHERILILCSSLETKNIFNRSNKRREDKLTA